MKKLFSTILVLGLLWCDVGFAERVNKSMQELLNDNYKITKEELAVLERNAHKIFTLKKGRNVIVCSVSIYKSSGVENTSRCIQP